MSNAPESLAIRWQPPQLALLDQRLLPGREHWLECQSAHEVAAAIRQMAVRGAPAIGISAAYGIALAARALGDKASLVALEPAFEVLAASRPTAVNLFWALERMRDCAGDLAGDALATALENEACAIHSEDLRCNEAIGAHGAALLNGVHAVYTHCNTGALATGGHGTALGIIRSTCAAGQPLHVYAGETRPWLQGARLTAWELLRDGIDVTLTVDSCAGHLMADGRVGAVIVGADRITANGDTVNKIGTYSLAVLARHHGLPFIVAAPCSTIDLSLTDGGAVIIEERDGAEVTQLAGQAVAAPGTPAYNPAFDVTPAELVSAIVTERGVVRTPTPGDLARHLEDT